MMFQPNLQLPPVAPPQAPPMEAPPIQAPQPMDEAPPAPPAFIPIPIVVQPPKPKAKEWSADIVRKAQTIYPQEAQAKAQMVDQAKTMPTPTGAWGAAK